ncbi:MAG: hypothetical protein QM736_17935 [Vicinamibacterales bacterium]
MTRCCAPRQRTSTNCAGARRCLDEMERNLVLTGTVLADKAARLRATMERFFPEAMVTGYEPLIAAMQNDIKDRHVVAAAVKAGAQVIITANLKDFTPLPDGIEAQLPDEFLCNLFDLDPKGFTEILGEQAVNLQNPPVTFEELLDRLARPAPDLIAAVRKYPHDRRSRVTECRVGFPVKPLSFLLHRSVSSSGGDALGTEMRYPDRLSWRGLSECFQPDSSTEVTYDVVEGDLCEATWPRSSPNGHDEATEIRARSGGDDSERTSTTPRIMDRRAHRSRDVTSTAGTPRSSPTSSDRCADICESRWDVLGTGSGRRSFAISTAVH